MTDSKDGDRMLFSISEELKKLPNKPGVYLMHDENDEIIYVGKAVSLRNRVRQYFQSSRGKGPKIERMVTHIRRFEYIVTDSEAEALVLECNLIKEHRPKYNTMLMDDKAYPFIRVTMEEAFPRIMLARRIGSDRGRNKYFGPYPSAGAVRDTIELLHKLYHIRCCDGAVPRNTGKERPCLYYQIGQCDAPCHNKITEEEYGEHVKEALEFLGGHYQHIQEKLRKQMEAAADTLDFETAAAYRDLLESISVITQKQKMTSSGGDERDIIAVAAGQNEAVAQVFFIRGGRLLGRDHYYLKIGEGEENKTILESFVKQYYAGTPYIPHEIMLAEDIEGRPAIETWLTNRLGKRVRILVPQKGQKEQLVELAAKNAAMVLEKDSEKLRREAARTTGAIKEIEEAIGIENIHRIEAYDISNTGGCESVGSMVVYENGTPKRSDYRKFRIRTIEGPNDTGSLREVLTRRFIHGLKEMEEQRTESFTRFPDLIMMDGGKGQVHAACEVLAKLGLSIPVCGMVKDMNHRTRGLLFGDEEVVLDRSSEGFKLVTRIQDEAHRFAISFHRSRRSSEQIHSILDDIPGIGEVRRRALRRQFATIESIRAASSEELMEVPGMNRKAAQAVYSFFHES